MTTSNAVPFDPAQLPSVFDINIDAPKTQTPAATTSGATASDATTSGETVSGAVSTSEAGRASEAGRSSEAARASEAGEGFAALGVPRSLVRALRSEGITEPFEIQTATLPDALKGRDVLGRGQTGSGKTLAFGLAVLARLAEGKPARPYNPRALIMVPTRELAMQVADALRPLARAVGIYLGTAVGGVPYDRQIQGLQRGLDLLVATPGRLGDLIERGSCSLEEITVSVLDEADQMADMGFLPDVTKLLEQTPADAQRLLFSATLDGDVDELVKRFMTDPVTHSTNPAAASVSTMDHMLLLIPPQEKFKVAASIANRAGRTIMFARTQMAVDRLVEQLREVGVRAGGLHGGKTQRVRTRTLAEFKEGRTGVLVATDVAARGIHVDGVTLVVHIDPPKDSKDYLHRAGRTARAGESGAVATLVLPKQRRSTLSMLGKAGVDKPAEHRVRIADPKLIELTGAREPSGKPVVDEPQPRRSGGDRGDRSRSGGGFRGRREGGPREGGRDFGARHGGDRRDGFRREGGRDFGAGRDGGAGFRREGGPREGGSREGGRDFGARREGGASGRDFGSHREGFRRESGPREGGRDFGARREGGFSREGGAREAGSRDGGRRDFGARHEGVQHEGVRHEGARREGGRYEGPRHEGVRHGGDRREGGRFAGGQGEGGRRDFGDRPRRTFNRSPRQA